MPKCPRCQEDKPLSSFSRDRTKSSGRCSHCKSCKNKAKQEWITPEYKREEALKWRQRNPWKYKASNVVRGWRSRDARLGLSLDTPPFQKIVDLWREQNFICSYCGVNCSLDTISVDHMVPVTKGGDHDLKNLTTCCLACNIIKRARSSV